MKRIASLIRRSAALASRGDGVLSRVILFALPVSYAIGTHIHIPFMIPLRIGIRCGASHTVVPVRHLSTIPQLEEIFVLEEYRTNEVTDPRIIVDLGSNIGISVRYFAMRYPDASIHAFEADPVTFAELSQNTKDLPHVQVHLCAIAGVDGKLTFYRNKASSTASSLKRRNVQDEEVAVRTARFDTILTELGLASVDLLKCDIEGAEAALVQGVGLGHVTAGICEAHYDLMPISREAFLSKLSAWFSVRERRIGEARSIISFTRFASKNEA